MKLVSRGGLWKPAYMLNLKVKSSCNFEGLTIVLDETNFDPKGGYDAVPLYRRVGASRSLTVDEITALNFTGVAARTKFIPALRHIIGTVFVKTNSIVTYREPDSKKPIHSFGMYQLHGAGLVSDTTGIEIPAGSVVGGTVLENTDEFVFFAPDVELHQNVESLLGSHKVLDVTDVHSVSVAGGTVSVHGTEQSYGALYHVTRATRLTYSGMRGQGRPYPNGMGSYIVLYDSILNLNLYNNFFYNGWGSTGGNRIGTMIVSGGTYNRIDVHWQIGSMTVDNVTLNELGIVISGLIDFVIARDCRQAISNKTTPGIVSTREDYGGHCFPGSYILVERATIIGIVPGDAVVVQLHPSNRNGIDVVMPDIFASDIKLIGLKGQCKLVDFGNNMSVDREETVQFPAIIDFKGVDATKSPKLHVQLLGLPNVLAKLPIIGGTNHRMHTIHNARYSLTGYKHSSGSIIPDHALISFRYNPLGLGENAFDVGSTWVGSNSLYPLFSVRDSDNVSIDLTAKNAVITVSNCTLVYYDTYYGSELADGEKQMLLVNLCSIKPLRIGSKNPKFFGRHANFNECTMYPARNSDGSYRSISLSGCSGQNNTQVVANTYLDTPVGFFEA